MNAEISSLQNSDTPAHNASAGLDAGGPSPNPQRQATGQPVMEKEDKQKPVMRLKILLPYRVFADESGVTHILVVTKSGAFGLLPHRLDCTAAIVPGILAYRNRLGEQTYLAVDEGVLIKTGSEVIISLRNAIGGQNLGKLQAAVEHEFLDLDERERSLRNLIAKVESDFVRRFLEVQRG